MTKADLKQYIDSLRTDLAVWEPGGPTRLRPQDSEALDELERLVVSPEAGSTIPLAPYVALGVLLNHIEPGWENCQAAARAWYESLPRPAPTPQEDS